MVISQGYKLAFCSLPDAQFSDIKPPCISPPACWSSWGPLWSDCARGHSLSPCCRKVSEIFFYRLSSSPAYSAFLLQDLHTTILWTFHSACLLQLRLGVLALVSTGELLKYSKCMILGDLMLWEQLARALEDKCVSDWLKVAEVQAKPESSESNVDWLFA